MQTLCQRKIDLSVIVPVYNLENYITPLLNSLKSQKTDPYNVEFIFVLNNCTDKSEEVIRESGAELNPIILTCDLQGCGNARNVGLEHAQGDYVWFMDGDDWLLDDYAIENALSKCFGKGYDIIRVPFDSNGFDYNYFSMVWQYVMRRNFISEFRFSHIQPCEDDEYMLKVLHKAGYSPATYLKMPHLLNIYYFYNYLREGSNMYRVRILGEDINGQPNI